MANIGDRKAEKPPVKAPRTRFMKHRGDFSWQGARKGRYKKPDGTWAHALRTVLCGGRGEHTRFHLRYFELAPGGYTTLERHRHEHMVVCVRGEGECTVRGRSYALEHLDAIYIPPDAPHQLLNRRDEPFGFFCIVDARRDRPRPIRK